MLVTADAGTLELSECVNVEPILWNSFGTQKALEFELFTNGEPVIGLLPNADPIFELFTNNEPALKLLTNEEAELAIAGAILPPREVTRREKTREATLDCVAGGGT